MIMSIIVLVIEKHQSYIFIPSRASTILNRTIKFVQGSTISKLRSLREYNKTVLAESGRNVCN